MSAQPIAYPAAPTARPAPRLVPSPPPTSVHTLYRNDRTWPASSTPYEQAVLAVDFRTRDNDARFGPQATPSGHLPDPQAWTRRLIIAVLETMAGLRPPGQVSRWLAPDLNERLQRAFHVSQRRGARPTHPPLVRRVSVCTPADGIAECSVVVVMDGRVRAVALRLAGVDGHWLMTALEVG